MGGSGSKSFSASFGASGFATPSRKRKLGAAKAPKAPKYKARSNKHSSKS